MALGSVDALVRRSSCVMLGAQCRRKRRLLLSVNSEFPVGTAQHEIQPPTMRRAWGSMRLGACVRFPA